MTLLASTTSALKTTPASPRHTVLVLDDDPVFGRILQYQLKVYGFDCVLCASSQDMREALRSGVTPDVFVLDYFLNGDTNTGLDICRELKTDSNSKPVMLLSANTEIEIIVKCLDTGANQFVTKPCDIRELIARIEAALRSGKPQSSRRRNTQVIKVRGDLSFHRRSRSLSDRKSGQSVTLTEKEAALLQALVESERWCVGRFEVFRSIYGFEMPPMNRSIDMLACRLRTKLRAVNPSYSILTARNEGYELVKQ